MRNGFACLSVLGIGAMLTLPAIAGTVYNNLTPINLIGVASRTGPTEIEAADDFLLGSQATINTASFVGLVTGTGGSVSQVLVNVYRVFPLDSNTVRTPNVPTRVNSPSDVELVTRDSAVIGQLTFSTSVLSASFTALNSVQAGGIHPSPLQTTGGNGPVTGQEVQFNVTFTIPITLAADHYFFVPEVSLTNNEQFYWLSASRPIIGAGTTPFAPDLQAWTRDANLDPDWLRVGMDIVGGATPPTYNLAFSLDTAVPEPSSIALVVAGLALIGFSRARAANKI